MSRTRRWQIIVLVAVALKQAWFLTIIPAWQVPDEPAHMAYVQAVVEQHRFPIFSDQGMDVSREMFRSLTAIENSNPHRLGRHYPPGFLTTPNTSDRLLTESDAPIRNLAARNSPVYYLAVAIPYVLAYHASLETRLFVMRIFSSLLLLLTVWLAVRIARTISTNDWFALMVGLVVGFSPAASLLFVGVNPDAGLTVLSTLALWLMLRPVVKKNIFHQAIILAVVVGVATSIKSPGWFLLGPAGVWWALLSSRLPIRQWLLIGASAVGVAVLVGGGWLAIQHHQSSSPIIDYFGANHQALSWQRVLNNDFFERPAIVFRTWWGHVGWSGVSRYNTEWAYSLALIGTAVAIMASIVFFWRRSWRIPAPVTLLIVAALTLEAMYQVLYWRAGLTMGATHFPIHGRYYLPLAVPLATFFVFGLSALFPKRVHWVGYGLAVAIVTTTTLSIGVQALHLYSNERLAGWCFGLPSL